MRVVVRRPYRFITAAIILSCGTVFMSNVVWDNGLLLNTPQGELIGWVAGVAAVLLVIGMLHHRIDRFIHFGLLLAGFAWITRTVFVALSDGPSAFAMWLSLAWVIVIVGTFLMEARDPLRNSVQA